MIQVKDEKYCDVTPDVSLMKNMASIQGNPASRIMELVDNAIDARIPGVPLVIDVNVVQKGKKEYIEVVDNGCGMTETVARSFFRLGDSQKRGKGKIGRFGMGCKVAIMGIGDTCIVETVPYGEEYGVRFLFDIRRFTQWDIPYSLIDANGKTHGTRIRIENLTMRIEPVGRFTERLHEQFAKVYKHFILTGNVTIRINRQKVIPQSVELLPGFYQAFDFMVDGKRVHGWCGAKKVTGANWKFGFDLINNGRIIKQNDFLTRVPHQSLSRLTGEIHLDDFETDVHKTDFIRHNPSFEKMQEMLMKEIEGMISEISKMTNKEVFEKYHTDMKRVSSSLNKVLNSYVFLNQIDIDEGIFKKMKQKAKKPTKRAKIIVPTEEPKEEMTTLEVENVQDIIDSMVDEEPVEEKPKKAKRTKKEAGLVVEEPAGVSAGYEQPPRRWVAIERDNAMYLNVEVNLDHPSYRKLEDSKVAVQMQNAVLDSVAEFILDEEKKQGGFIESEVERLNQLKDMLIRCSITI